MSQEMLVQLLSDAYNAMRELEFAIDDYSPDDMTEDDMNLLETMLNSVRANTLMLMGFKLLITSAPH